MNKEKMGLTKRISVRLPKEIYEWLKEKSDDTRGSICYLSMNEYIIKSLEEYRKKCSSSQ